MQLALENFIVTQQVIAMHCALCKNFDEIEEMAEDECQVLAKFYDCTKGDALLLSTIVCLHLKGRMITKNVLRKRLKMSRYEACSMELDLETLRERELVYFTYSKNNHTIYHASPMLLEMSCNARSLTRLLIIENAGNCFTQKVDKGVVRKYKYEKSNSDIFHGITATEILQTIKRLQKCRPARIRLNMISFKN